MASREEGRRSTWWGKKTGFSIKGKSNAVRSQFRHGRGRLHQTEETEELEPYQEDVDPRPAFIVELAIANMATAVTEARSVAQGQMPAGCNMRMADDSHNARYVRDVFRWFVDDTDGPFSFVWTCHMLNYDPDWFRPKVLQQLREKADEAGLAAMTLDQIAEHVLATHKTKRAWEIEKNRNAKKD